MSLLHLRLLHVLRPLQHPLGRVLLHEVEGRSGLEPLPLALVEGVGGLERVLRTVGALALNGDLLSGLEVVKTNNGELVGTLDEVVVGLVLEPEGEETLLLQVLKGQPSSLERKEKK